MAQEGIHKLIDPNEIQERVYEDSIKKYRRTFQDELNVLFAKCKKQIAIEENHREVFMKRLGINTILRERTRECARRLLRNLKLESVSYTHLTLPTITKV